jgi:hypothetical protein
VDGRKEYCGLIKIQQSVSDKKFGETFSIVQCFPDDQSKENSTAITAELCNAHGRLK